MKKFYLVALLSFGMYAQNLIPDTSFGVNGVANTDVIGRRHIWPAPNNRLYTIDTFLATILRFNENGSADNTFSGNGNLDFVSEFGQFNYDINGMVFGDGNVFAFGYFHPAMSDNNNMFVAKMDLEGNYDTAFGVNGVAALDYGQDERIWSIHLTSTGKIFCLGWRDIPGQRIMILARLNSDGSKDLSFGTAGIREYAFNTGNNFADYAVIDSNDKLYVAFSGSTTSGPAESLVVKLDINGDVVTGFADQGFLHFNPVNQDFFSKLVLQGKNLYALSYFFSPNIAANTSTLRVYDMVEDEVTLTLPLTSTTRTTDFHVWPDGKIITYGYDFCSIGCFGKDVSLAQYQPDGTLDTGFDGDGVFQFNYNTIDGNNSYEISGQLFPVVTSKLLISAEYCVQPNVNDSNEIYLAMARFGLGTLATNSSEKAMISVYPNPTRNDLNVSLPEDVAFPLQLSVINAIGQTLFSSQHNSAANRNLSVDTSALASGFYAVKVADSSEKTLTQKFIKQ
jgi:uncharacterized delta-60 repeat protein